MNTDRIFASIIAEHRFICSSEWVEADYLFILLVAEAETLPRYVLVS